MSELNILITALLFYFIGKYSTTQKEKQIVEKIKEAIKPKIKPGAINFKDDRQIEYEESEEYEEEKVWDKVLSKVSKLPGKNR